MLIRYARCIIESSIGKGKICDDRECIAVIPRRKIEELSSIKTPVFVSLEKLVQDGSVIKRVLRGSMGVPRPTLDLLCAVKYAAYYAAFCDPRKGPLRPSELRSCVIELTVLFHPTQVKLEELPERLTPGYHSVIVELSSGDVVVLLPHVQVELAEKLQESGAILDMDAFIRELLKCKLVKVEDVTSVYLYDTQIFYELYPRGQVIERRLYRNRALEVLQRRASCEVHSEFGNIKTRYILR